jgi:PST family polysaccharide transporter
MVQLGGALTLNSLIVYVAYNVDKVLLGRFWGARTIGSYGRAYTLVNIPTESMNAAIGSVAIAALSRLQDDPARLKVYFLKGYSLVLALTLPATLACFLLSEEIVYVILGPKWSEAAILLKLLSPTILVFALINPTFWLVFSAGLMGRSLKMAMVIAPLVITGYAIGLPYGAHGVALGYSIAMSLWLVPHIVWSLHGTAVSPREVFGAAAKPLVSGLVGALACFAFLVEAAGRFTPFPRLLLGATILVGVYAGVLLYAMKQKPFYVDLLRTIFKKPEAEPPLAQSAVAAADPLVT